MTVQDLCEILKSKDRLYYNVLRRHFKEKANDVFIELISNRYFTLTILYRCPNCGLAIANREDFGTYFDDTNCEALCCYNCDSDIKYDKLIAEPLLIRTKKEYKSND